MGGGTTGLQPQQLFFLRMRRAAGRIKKSVGAEGAITPHTLTSSYSARTPKCKHCLGNYMKKRNYPSARPQTDFFTILDDSLGQEMNPGEESGRGVQERNPRRKSRRRIPERNSREASRRAGAQEKNSGEESSQEQQGAARSSQTAGSSQH